MSKKCLIVYGSHTGNTEKVALRFKKTFEKHGWECNSFRLDQKTDINHLPFNFKDYDFICVGSGMIAHTAYGEVIMAMRVPRATWDPEVPISERLVQNPYDTNREGRSLSKFRPHFPHHKIVLGTGSKKAVAFVTYSGYDLGAKEAEPGLAQLALEVEHLEFQCIGRFSCPGKFLDEPTPETFLGDIRDRPSERDLMKAEIFIEEILEEMGDNR